MYDAAPLRMAYTAARSAALSTGNDHDKRQCDCNPNNLSGQSFAPGLRHGGQLF